MKILIQVVAALAIALGGLELLGHYVVPEPYTIATQSLLVRFLASAGVFLLLTPLFNRFGRAQSSTSPVPLRTQPALQHLRKPAAAEQPRPTNRVARETEQLGGGNTSTRVDYANGGYLLVQTTVENGTTRVTVDAHGFSGQYFKKVVLPRLSRIGAVKWEKPVNVGQQHRRLTGTTSSAADAIKAIANR